MWDAETADYGSEFGLAEQYLLDRTSEPDPPTLAGQLWARHRREGSQNEDAPGDSQEGAVIHCAIWCWGPGFEICDLEDRANEIGSVFLFYQGEFRWVYEVREGVLYLHSPVEVEDVGVRQAFLERKSYYQHLRLLASGRHEREDD